MRLKLTKLNHLSNFPKLNGDDTLQMVVIFVSEQDVSAELQRKLDDEDIFCYLLLMFCKQEVKLMHTKGTIIQIGSASQMIL